MTERTKTIFSRGGAAATGGGLMSLLRTRSLIALILLLLVFVAGIELARPGTVNAVWVSNMLLFAAPLGIIAAGQTLVMLTGGIDCAEGNCTFGPGGVTGPPEPLDATGRAGRVGQFTA